MPQSEGQPFEDPALKAAVGRLWGQERAPQELRQRAQSALSSLSDSRTDSAFPRIGFGNPQWSPLYGLAAAAVILLVLGGVAYRMAAPMHGSELVASAAVPAQLASDMVRTHDFCAQHGDHHSTVAPGDDFRLIAQTLQTRLHHPILAAPLPGGPWTFRGAAICHVGRIPSAHLVYVHGEDAVSVFSLPPSVLAAAGGECLCEATSADHPIAGFVRGGGFYCLVGSSPHHSLTPQNLRDMRDGLRAGMTLVAADQPERRDEARVSLAGAAQ